MTEDQGLIALALIGVAFLAVLIIAIVRANRRNVAEDLRRDEARRAAQLRVRDEMRARQASSDGFSDRLAASRSAAASAAPRPLSLSKDVPASRGGLALPEPVPPSSQPSTYRPSSPSPSRRKKRRGYGSGRRSGSSSGGYSSGADCSSGGGSSCGGGGSSCGGGGGGD